MAVSSLGYEVLTATSLSLINPIHTLLSDDRNTYNTDGHRCSSSINKQSHTNEHSSKLRA